MRARFMGLLLIATACSSQNDAGTTSTGESSSMQPSQGAALEGTLTPSNLPADICDTPGIASLDVPAGTTLAWNPSEPCDVVVPQSDGLQPICVRKLLNVTVAGTLNPRAPLDHVLAIVATDTFNVAAGGIVDASNGPGAFDPRGSGKIGNGGGGGGHIGPGRPGTGSGGGAGGPAYGPTTGTQLVTGCIGAPGGTPWGGMTGAHGGALQIVACRDLHLSGTVRASGAQGGKGSSVYVPHVQYPGPGGGGGSGGTLVLEASRVFGTGSLLAKGGKGGDGGGLGAGAGGDAAPGRIVVNVPEGVSLPAFTSDPPADIGVIGTH